MSEQITWSRFVGPSLPDSLVLANYQSWLMTIDHQETWNSCQRVLCCHIWIILRNTWIWRIIAKYFLRSFSKYFWEQSDTINQLIIADLESDEWRKEKLKRVIAIMDRHLKQNLWILSSQINYDLWLTLVGCKTDFSPTK